MYLGVRLVLAKSIERIHRANLVNFAIVPAEFADAADYDAMGANDELVVEDFAQAVREADDFEIVNKTRGTRVRAVLRLSPRDRAILAAGGKLNYTRRQQK